MYLTRVFLNPASQAVQADARDPVRLHKTVMLAFPDDAGPSPRRTLGVLHRLDQEPDGRLVLLVQSKVEPLIERWPSSHLLDLSAALDLAFSTVGDNPAVKNLAEEHAALSAGRRFLFRLRANATRKIDTKTGADGKRRHGRRVPVRGEDGRLDWLQRRAQNAGFVVERDAVRVTELRSASGRGNKAVTLAGALFEGLLVVRDAELFRVALQTGIGPAKAYGFGLLSIRKAP